MTAEKSGTAERSGDAETVPIDARLLVPALLAWIAVAALLSLRPLVLTVIAATFAGLGLTVMHHRWRRRSWVTSTAVALLGTALALLATAAHSSVREAGLVPGLASQRAMATIEAVIVTDPRVVMTKGVRPTELVIVKVSVRTVVGRGQRSESSTPVMLFGDTSWAHVRWRERVRISGRFDVADPGDDVVAIFNPSGPPVSVGEPGLIADVAEHVRSGLRDAVSGLPLDARGLLPGLVIGDTSRTPQSLTDAMLKTGMTHLSAVSGSNVAVVLVAAMAFCRVVGVRRRWRPPVALLLLAGFVILARPEPSVLRAAVMGVIGLLGLSTSRRRMGIPALSGAVLVLLCIDPWLSRSFGFALSTLATLGLLLFARPWGAWFARFLPRRLKGLGVAIAIPVAAQAMCGPVVVLLQGSVTLIGVVANLLAAPLVAPATVLGVSVALVALISHPLAVLLGWLAALPTLGIAWVARACAGVPMGTMPWPDGAPGAILLALLTIGLLFTGPWLMATFRGRPYLVVALALLGLAAAWPTSGLVWPSPGWRIVACDVGQGDGLVLASGQGHAVVVDVGPDSAAIDGCLKRLKVEVVDALVLTHFHADHVDGLRGVLHGRIVRQILTSPVPDPAFQTHEVQSWAAAAGIPIQQLYAGDQLTWGSVQATVLWPARVMHEGSVPNNASVVLSVSIGGLHVLMLGDVETPAAHEVLLALRRDPVFREGCEYDVLKVAHHGSRLQDPALLAEVGAPVALISVGADNTYGHPAPGTVDLLKAAGSQVFRTDQRGDIAIARTSDGTVLVSSRRGS
ncbi:MAG: MBL fold metallo-hydrolase [Phycicoccus sp.]|nr:MBL fold metallo-hydrolase [Phycicoccus sp.]NMM33224.1 MBL fold metallo-hydrolase [Phycicoccus sp.]